jgi:hypothetical protein
MAAVSGNRVTGHQRVDHKFAFKLFEYDEPDNFQCEDIRTRTIGNDVRSIKNRSSMHQNAIFL